MLWLLSFYHLGTNMEKWYVESSECLEASDKTMTYSTSTKEDRIRFLRQEYLNGELTVDSKRLAEKMLSFEKQLEIAFPAIHSETNGSKDSH